MLTCDPAEGAIEKQKSAQLAEAEADNGGFFEDNDDADWHTCAFPEN